MHMYSKIVNQYVHIYMYIECLKVNTVLYIVHQRGFEHTCCPVCVCVCVCSHHKHLCARAFTCNTLPKLPSHVFPQQWHVMWLLWQYSHLYLFLLSLPPSLPPSLQIIGTPFSLCVVISLNSAHQGLFSIPSSSSTRTGSIDIIIPSYWCHCLLSEPSPVPAHKICRH